MEGDPLHTTYEGQFDRYLLISQGFLKRMNGYQDRKISLHWMQRGASLMPSSAALGRDRNLFFQYFITVMKDAILEEVLKQFPKRFHDFKQSQVPGLDFIQNHPEWLNKELEIAAITQMPATPKAPYFAHWSVDRKTYLAAKALPGEGALVYLAVCTDPSLGWSNLAE